MKLRRFLLSTGIILSLLLSACDNTGSDKADPPETGGDLIQSTEIPDVPEMPDVTNAPVNKTGTIMDTPHRSNKTPDIYVSPAGNDSTGNGTKEKPYATLEKAKMAVRALPKNNGDIVIELADGFYNGTDTVTFDENDSGNESCTIYYQAAQGEEPVLSGGKMLPKNVWTLADTTEVPQAGGLPVYKTTLVRNNKLRAIYVNGNRANMTQSDIITKSDTGVTTVGVPTVSVAGYTDENTDNQWAWHSANDVQGGIIVHKDYGLTVDTKNPQNIEAERVSGAARWARPFVCFASVESAPDGAPDSFKDGVLFRYQMPYAIISQSLSNGTNYTGNADQVIRNAFEFLNKPGDFYFDQAENTLYYIPVEGEDINAADVVIPQLDMIIEVKGSNPVGDRTSETPDKTAKRAEYITFSGLTFTQTDYSLYKLTGTYTWSDDGPLNGSKTMTSESHGFASVQGCINNTVYYATNGSGSINWHETFYRGYEIPPAAIRINAARNIRVLDGKIGYTGFNGIHLENDVADCEVTGNYIPGTLSSGLVVGHPQHVYENDLEVLHESSNSAIRAYAGVDKEMFSAGTEAAPQNVYIANNFFYKNCYGFPGANTLTSFYTTNMQVLHNYMYSSSYGAISVGWGWCEYDGFGYDENGDNNTDKTGGPYAGTSEESVARSKAITTTSRNNKINYNRIEEVCAIVNDSGAIYSLGRQGDPGNLPDGGSWFDIAETYPLDENPVTDKNSNWHYDNWTDFTEMNYNFLDPNKLGKHTTSSDWTNGFHPDEGSAFIKFIGNVVQNKNAYNDNARAYEFNNWKRKNDMIATGGYIDARNEQNGGPRIINNETIDTDRIWGTDGHDVVLYSGLTDEYIHLLRYADELLITDIELELASNVRLGKGDTLNRRGLLSAEDTVWIAPEGTTSFAEGSTMTKAAGNEKSISVPATDGQYKLYIVYNDTGRGVAVSEHTIYVGNGIS